MGQTILHLLPACLLLVAAAASLGAYLYVFPSETAPEEWRPAAEHVLEHIESNDVVRTHPPWNVDALPYLEEIGDQVNRQIEPLAEDLYHHDRVWVLTESSRVDEALERLPFSTDEVERNTFGDATVLRAPIPEEAGFSWEFLEHLSEVKVERLIYEKGENVRTRHCKNWSERDRRWDCGSRNNWLYVGEVYKFLGGDPHRAIWAHPVPKGNRLRLTFSDVPLEEILRIRAGFTHKASRRQRGSETHMKVSIDGRTQIRETFPRLETTWDAHEIDTSDRSGSQATVEIEIWASNIRDRYFCLNGWIR